MPDSFYVTTPIYYVNDAPHIGHAYTTVHADALARWRRLHGDDVLFLTGTDEHGLKIQRAAEERGVSPIEWADTTSARFRDAWALLDISNDDFIRTTEPRHHAAVQAFLSKVYDNGFIELATYEGLYCVACEAYYTEDDLVDGNCPIHGTPVELVKEENYFFKLSRFEQRLLDWYDAHPDAIVPAHRRNEVLGFIKGGLRDFSISRTSLQ
ncbi:MAG: class I tRNA ligase family protein, partial [Acidimicrobiia bacterium]